MGTWGAGHSLRLLRGVEADKHAGFRLAPAVALQIADARSNAESLALGGEV